MRFQIIGHCNPRENSFQGRHQKLHADPVQSCDIISPAFRATVKSELSESRTILFCSGSFYDVAFFIVFFFLSGRKWIVDVILN